MLRPRVIFCLAAACGAFACGDRPDLPGPTTPSGTGTAASTSSGARPGTAMMLEAQPPPEPAEPVAVAPEPVAAPDAGRAPVGDEAVVVQSSPDPVGPSVAINACTVTELGCVRLYIAVADTEAKSCLQLLLDDCNDTTRAGFAVTVPLSWRFGSGFVGELGADCAPKTAFVATSTTIVSGTGSIGWNVDTRQPSEVVIDVKLQPSSSAVDSRPIQVTNSELVDPITECDR